MHAAIKEFCDAFPAHEIDFKPRPDGTLLLTLRQPGQVPLSQAIDKARLLEPASVRELIHDLTLGLRRANGQALLADDCAGWCPRELPTFSGEPLHVPAVRTLVYRGKMRGESAQCL